MKWWRDGDSDNPETMTYDQIVGVRIGLRLATTLLDNRAIVMTGRSKAAREKAEAVQALADEVHSMRHLFDPRAATASRLPSRADPA